MNQPLKVTYRQVIPSDEITDLIRRYAAKLHEVHDRIISCRAVVELPHRNQRKGAQYRVRVALAVPGGYLVAGRAPVAAARHTDLRVAVADAFRAVEQMLRGHARKQGRPRAFGKRRRGNALVRRERREVRELQGRA